MKVESGREAVWRHAKECGMGEKIALIAKYFDINDVSIIGNGKLTYLHERPRKVHRVPATPTGKADVKSAIEKTKQVNKHYKK